MLWNRNFLPSDTFIFSTFLCPALCYFQRHFNMSWSTWTHDQVPMEATWHVYNFQSRDIFVVVTCTGLGQADSRRVWAAGTNIRRISNVRESSPARDWSDSPKNWSTFPHPLPLALHQLPGSVILFKHCCICSRWKRTLQDRQNAKGICRRDTPNWPTRRRCTKRDTCDHSVVNHDVITLERRPSLDARVDLVRASHVAPLLWFKSVTNCETHFQNYK